MSTASIHKYCLLSVYIDLSLAALALVMVGSIYNLVYARFHALDVVATLVEGFTGVRCLDYSQDTRHWHSLNVASWPLQSLMRCVVMAPGTYAFNTKIASRFRARGYYMISVLSIFSVTIFTVFGVMHSDTNIFYANATSFTYLTMEFSLGLHFYFLLCQEEVCSHVLWGFLHHFRMVIYLLFACIWWSEVGAGVKAHGDDQDVCLRLYCMNSCLPGQHAFMLRGCLLGLAMITSLPDMVDQVYASVAHLVPAARSLCSAVPFCWPVFLSTKLVLDISFGKDSVNANRALVAVIMPCIATVYAFLFDSLSKLYLLEHAVGAWTALSGLAQAAFGGPRSPLAEDNVLDRVDEG